MLSKILVKLIDKAIIPTILLLSARVISIVLVAKYMDINIKINSEGLITQNSAEYVKLNSYSILFMLAMLIIGLMYIATKGLVFHDSHIKPTITSRLFSIKAKSLIQSSSEIYPQWGVWALYSLCYRQCLSHGYVRACIFLGLLFSSFCNSDKRRAFYL